MKILLLASAATALIAAPAFAQEAAPADDSVIVVLGKGLPDTPATPAYSTIELDREAITTTSSDRLEDALSNVAGFQQFRRSDSRSSNPTAQGATLRALGGNASSRALVLLDGVPMIDPFFGYVPFSAVSPETLSRIQVTRGGGSGPFGAGALAGTIALESASARELGLVNAAAFVNDREETSLSATLAPEFGNGYAVISGRWDRGDGFETTPEDQRVAISVPAAYDSWTAGGRVVQKLGDLEVQLRGLAFEDHRTLRFEGANNSIEGQDVSLRVVSRGPWQVDAIAYGQWRNFSNVVISSSRFTRVLDQKDTPASGQGGKIEVRPPVGDANTLRIGTDYRRSEGDLFEDAYSAFSGNRTEERFAGGVNTDVGFFIENDFVAGPLTLTGGVRADRYTIRNGYYRSFDGDGNPVRDDTYSDRADWEVTWRAGALFDVAEIARLRAAAYTGFRLPTINELYRPFVVFPVVTNANAELLPERLEGFEAGIDLMPAPGVMLQATWFDNKVKDAIANVTIATNTRQRRNLDAIDATGFEFAARAESGAFSFDGTLVLTDAKVVGTGAALNLDGNRPSQVPEVAASATLGWRPVEGALFSATLRHVGDQYEDDQETNVLPAATTVDLYARMPVTDGLSAVARVENLFDETIVTRNQNGSMDLGTPLTVWVGVNFAM
mgnify:CR=1 FL=1